MLIYLRASVEGALEQTEIDKIEEERACQRLLMALFKYLRPRPSLPKE